MKKIIILLLISISLITYGETKIKIASNITDMYLYKNLYTGEYEGVYSEILKDIDKNIKYSFDYKEQPEILLRVTKKEKYPNYNFITVPVNYRVIVLVNKNSGFRNISDLNGLKIGYVENRRGIEEIEDRYSALEYEKIKIKNEDIALEKLEKREIDGLIVQDYIERNSFESKVRIVEDILYREQVGVRKDCTNLYEKVEKNIKERCENNFLTILRRNRIAYYKYLLQDTPSYNIVKERYKSIKVTIPKDKYLLPLYYSIGKKYDGILIDILKEIEEILEIPIELINDEGDICGIVVESEKSKKKFNISRPYFESQIGIANRKFDSFTVGLSDLDNSKILLLERDEFLKEYVDSTVKNNKIILVSTMEEGFRKLILGDGDYFINFSSFLESGITNRFLDGQVKLAGESSARFSVALGVNEEAKDLGQVINIIMRGFAIDKTVLDLEANNNILVAKNYKLITQISVTVGIFILVLLIILVRSEKNRKKAEELSSILVETIESINQLNQEEAGDHAKRFSLYSVLMAKELGLEKKKIDKIGKYAGLHDLGKIIVPNEVLNKAGKLTKEEFEQVKKHTIVGYQLVKKLNLGKTAGNIVKYHHEKWNGLGYPFGLKGEEIPIESRIASIVDTYDTLRQDKSYRAGVSHKEAVKIIEKESGSSFDPILVEIFLKLNKEFEKIYKENDVELYLADEILTALKK